MSGVATGWVLKHGPKDRAMRAVLVAIADDADRFGEHSRPGLAAIIDGSLYGRASVLQALTRLRVEGWIEVEEEPRRGSATTYRIPGVVTSNRPPVDIQKSDPIRGAMGSNACTQSRAMGSNPASNGVQPTGPHPDPLLLSLDGNYNGKAVAGTGTPASTPPHARPTSPPRSLQDDLEEARGYPTRQHQARAIADTVRRARTVHRNDRAKLVDLADGYLEAGVPPDQITQALTDASCLTTASIDIELSGARRAARHQADTQAAIARMESS